MPETFIKFPLTLKFPTKRHLGGFFMSTFFQQNAQAMISNTSTASPYWNLSRWLIGNRSSIPESSKIPLPSRPPQPSRPSLVIHVQSRSPQPMTQPFRPRTRSRTLCRYRNWLAQDNTLAELLVLEIVVLFTQQVEKNKPAIPRKVSLLSNRYMIWLYCSNLQIGTTPCAGVPNL